MPRSPDGQSIARGKKQGTSKTECGLTVIAGSIGGKYQSERLKRK